MGEGDFATNEQKKRTCKTHKSPLGSWPQLLKGAVGLFDEPSQFVKKRPKHQSPTDRIKRRMDCLRACFDGGWCLQWGRGASGLLKTGLGGEKKIPQTRFSEWGSKTIISPVFSAKGTGRKTIAWTDEYTMVFGREGREAQTKCSVKGKIKTRLIQRLLTIWHSENGKRIEQKKRQKWGTVSKKITNKQTIEKGGNDKGADTNSTDGTTEERNKLTKLDKRQKNTPKKQQKGEKKRISSAGRLGDRTKGRKSKKENIWIRGRLGDKYEQKSTTELN